MQQSSMTFFRGGSSNTDTNRFGGGGGRVLFRFLALAIDLLQHVVHRRTLNSTGGVITVCVESLLQDLVEINTQFLSHCKQCFFIYLSIAVGTATTDRPPHRSVRAELPHTAKTRTGSVRGACTHFRCGAPTLDIDESRRIGIKSPRSR